MSGNYVRLSPFPVGESTGPLLLGADSGHSDEFKGQLVVHSFSERKEIDYEDRRSALSRSARALTTRDVGCVFDFMSKEGGRMCLSRGFNTKSAYL